MNLFHNKKGLSPLIATILLIAFAVALGAVVMNLGTPSEADLGFSIMEIGGKKLICYFDRAENSALELTITNGKDVDIENFQISLIGTNDIINKDHLLEETLKKGTSVRLMVMYDAGQVGELRKISITPHIVRNGERTLGTRLDIENIEPC